jgi:hypothetical protein
MGSCVSPVSEVSENALLFFRLSHPSFVLSRPFMAGKAYARVGKGVQRIFTDLTDRTDCAARKRAQQRERKRRYLRRQASGAAVLRIEVAENALVGVAMNDAPAKPISVEMTAILREIVAELRGLRADLARRHRSGTADSQCDERASVLLKAIAEEAAIGYLVPASSFTTPPQLRKIPP